MNPGNIVLVLALIASFSSLAFVMRSSTGNLQALDISRKIFFFTSGLIACSVTLLAIALLTHRFEYAYVYSNSARSLSPIYLFASLWAGQEGSFLLWLFILNILGVIIIQSRDTYENVLISAITITQIFILMILIIESPFTHIWDKFPEFFKPGEVPLDGTGLNPLLIDPWMVAHPPVLFLGYASATIPFGYAIAGLLKNDFVTWIERSYRWLLFSMTTLGIGIFMGGYWAYKVLGWGGYWGWDPVENSSLIPWLIAVALVHGMILMRRKGALVKTTIVLSLLYFIMVFYATFLTRSGVLSDFSVHSFGDLGLSKYLTFILVFFISISLFLFIMRYNQIESKPLISRFMQWETFMVYGIITILIYTGFIFFGTSMPIISGMMLQHPSKVHESFYNNISIPFGILILLLMFFSTVIMQTKNIVHMKQGVFAVIAIIGGVLFNLFYPWNAVAYAFSIAAILVIVQYISDLVKNRSRGIVSSRIAHIGVGIMVLGIISSNFHSSTEQKMLSKDTSEKFLSSSLDLSFREFKGGEKSSLRFQIKQDGAQLNFSTPYFTDAKTKSLYREPYVRHGFFGDIYIIPESFQSGIESISSVTLHKGESQKLDDLTVTFIEFKIKDMTSDNPSVIAVVDFNGQRVEIEKKMTGEGSQMFDKIIPGTNRTVSLLNVDAQEKMIVLYVAPGKNTKIPPDGVLVNVSFKRLIWLVWLGTILISAGAVIAFSWKRRG